MCSVSRVEIHISKFWLQTAAVFHNQHLLCLQLFHCSHPCFLTQNQKFALFWGVRNESYFNSSYLSTCELSCCEEHELSSEQWWKHLPVWVVYMRKSWDEIQRLYVGRSLKIVFCGGEAADDHPSPSCVFTLQPPSFCSQWRNLSGVLTPIFLLSTLNLAVWTKWALFTVRAWVLDFVSCLFMSGSQPTAKGLMKDCEGKK